jgi:hypothetical protein
LAHVLSLKTVLAATIALYALNQMALLPPPLSSAVSKVLFWPTLPVTVLRRVGKWTTVIDDSVVMGGAPFGFAGLPRRLYEDYGVRTRTGTLIKRVGCYCCRLLTLLALL